MWWVWVFVAIGGIVLLIVAVLSIPVDVNIRLASEHRPRFRVRFRWLFGLVKGGPGGGKKPDAGKKKAKPERSRKPGKKRIRFGTFLELTRIEGLSKQFWLLLKRLLRIPDIKDASVDLTVGLGDPADTAMLFAFIAPAAAMLDSAVYERIYVRPAYDELVLEGRASASVRVLPIRIFPPVMGFVFSIPVIRAAKRLVAGRWRRN